MKLERKEIIEELIKYSQLIKDKTPSEKDFLQNTRVGIMDRKRYWPNYGKLVSEAGLKPNIFDKTKYTQDELCELFIQAIRDKEKWPTRDELDIKHYNDPLFPDSSTFYKKIGKIQDGSLVKALSTYIENKNGYNDIYKILEKKEPKGIDKIQIISKGYVYLRKSKLKNAVVYKIGITNNPERRDKELRQKPNEEETIHLIETDDPKGIEAYWHKRFKDKHYKNEWFELNSIDINSFKKWRKII